MPARISGFADEISPNVDEQIAGLRQIGINYIALRSGNGKNVMAWTDAEADRIKKALDAGGIGVSEIGSPVGKTKIDEPFEKTAEALAHAVKLAKRFETPNIRLFSFYPPSDGGPLGDHRDEVIRRIRAMVDQVAGEPVVLMMENEADIYGDYPEQVADIFANVRSPQLRLAFDFANFVSRKAIDVYNDAWKPLRPFVSHIHVKDYQPGAKHACPAGEGFGCIPQILAELARDNYGGFMTLEPHLAKAGSAGGFSGLDNFRRAFDALMAICRRVGLAVQ